MSALSSLLVRDQIVGVRRIEEALQRQVVHGGDLETNLLEIGGVSEDDLAQYRAQAEGLQPVSSWEVMHPEPSASRRLSAELAERHGMVPLRLDGTTLVVAVYSVPPPATLDELSFLLSADVVPRIATELRLRVALHALYGIPLPPRFERLAQRLGPPSQLTASPVVEVSPNPTRTETGPSSPEAPLAIAAEPTTTEGSAASAGTTAGVAIAEPIEPVGSGRDEETQRMFLAFSAERTAQGHPRPSTPAGAAELMALAASRDEVLEIVLDVAHQVLSYVAIFSVHDDIAEGRLSIGDGTGTEALRGIAIPLDQPSFLSTVKMSAALYLGSIHDEGLNSHILKQLGRDRPANVLVMPVAVRSRVVLLVYGDNGRMLTTGEEIADLLGVPLAVSAAFQRLILARKSGKDAKVQPKPKDAIDLVRSADAPSAEAEGAFATPAEFPQGPSRAPTPFPEAVSLHEPSPSPDSFPGISEPAPALATSAEATESHDASEPSVSTRPRRNTARFPVPIRKEASPVGETLEMSVAPPPEPTISAEPPAEPIAEPLVAEPLVVEPDDALLLAARAVLGESAEEPDEEHGATAHDEPYVDFGDIEIGDLTSGQPGWPHGAERPAPVWDVGGGDEVFQEIQAALQVTSDQFDPDEERQRPVGDRTTDPAPPPMPRQPQELGPVSGASGGRRRPAPDEGLPQPQPVPSIIVDMGPNVESLVDSVERGGEEGDLAAAALQKIGEAAIPALVQRFPGPLRFDRRQPHTRLPRVAECGPILRLIPAFRRQAVPYLQPLLAASSADVRFYAAFLFSELQYPEAIAVLQPLLFDTDYQTRILAVDVLKGFTRFPEIAPVLDHLRRTAWDASLPLHHRRIAIEAIGELRDSGAVALLIELLGHDDQQFSELCRKALILITRQDFGQSKKKWKSWLDKEGARHHIEWLIDALVHPSPDLRLGASEELKRITKEYFGYYYNLPRRDREKARKRYLDWWERVGRGRFTPTR